MEEDKSKPKKLSNIAIVGLNLGILAGYTILSKFSPTGDVADPTFIALHVVACVMVASATKRRAWFLSALTVLIVGISTCTLFIAQSVG